MRTAAAVLLALILALPAFAASRADEPVPAFAPAFDPVPDAPTRLAHATGSTGAYVDRMVQPVLPSGRPHVAIPSPRLIVVPRGSPQPTSHRASGTATGRASWYDDGPGLYAAAGPALRVGSWRGRSVRACVGSHCVRVVLSDWCQCYWKRPNERVIDLSPAAFSRLAPLSRGLVKVTVSWT